MLENNYQIYKKHKTEIFEMIYDVIKRAPVPKDLAFYFGTQTSEQQAEYDKEMNEYIKEEEPRIKERIKQMGFIETKGNDLL